MLKKCVNRNVVSPGSLWAESFFSLFGYVVAGRTGVVGWLRNRTSRLMF